MIFDPGQWLWDALLESSAQITSVALSADRAEVTLSTDDGRGEQQVARFRLLHLSAAKPSTALPLTRSGTPTLVVMEKTSQSTVDVLRSAGSSWIAHRPLRTGLRGELLIGDRRVALSAGPDPTALRVQGPKPGRPGNAAARILQELLWQGRATQQHLVAETGISQARVSQVLAAASTTQWLTPAKSRPVEWTVADPAGLIDHWLATYRPARRVQTFWYSLADLRTQVLEAVELLAPHAWVSGAMAADALAPWSVPQSALVYTTSTPDLGAAGLVPSQAREASLRIVVTDDLAVSPRRSAQRVIDTLTSAAGPLPVADPLVVLWDLSQSEDLDADQAAKHLRDALIAHVQARYAS